jgi:hypothetical protein
VDTLGSRKHAHASEGMAPKKIGQLSIDELLQFVAEDESGAFCVDRFEMQLLCHSNRFGVHAKEVSSSHLR